MDDGFGSLLSLRVATHLSSTSGMYGGLRSYPETIRGAFEQLFSNMFRQIGKQREWMWSRHGHSSNETYITTKYHAILWEGSSNATQSKSIKSVEFVEFEIHGIGSIVRHGIFVRHTTHEESATLGGIMTHAKTNPKSLSAPWGMYIDINRARETWDAAMKIATDELGPILVARDCQIVNFTHGFALKWTLPVQGFATRHFDHKMRELHPTTGSPLVPIRLYD